MKIFKIVLCFILFGSVQLAFSQTGNNCASAIPILSTPYSQNSTTCGKVNDYTSGAACEAPYNFGQDVIYSFTPALTQSYSLSLSGFTTTGNTGPSIAVSKNTCGFASACGANYTAFVPAATTATSISGAMVMTAGVTYYIKIDNNAGCSTYIFTIDVTPPIFGSNCIDARMLYPKTSCTPPGFPTNDMSNVLNTVSSADLFTNDCLLNEDALDASAFAKAPFDAACTPEDDRTQVATWAEFKATGNTTTLSNNNSGAGVRSYDYTVYTGDCITMNLVGCFTVAKGASQSFATVPGTFYYVMITASATTVAAQATQHWLCVTSPVSTPTNPLDKCSQAFPVTDGAVYRGSNALATRDGFNTLCGALAISNNNIWYKWSTPATWVIGQLAFIHLTNQDCNYSGGVQLDVYQSNLNCANITAGGTANCITFNAPNNTTNFFATFIPIIGSTYYINIDGSCGAVCTFDLQINNTAAVPVTWLSLSAKATKEGNVLSWATAVEKNSDYFWIERSREGIEFEQIGKIAGQGNSSAPHDYKYTDLQPGVGISYYRLKQVDFDGGYSYSTIISARSAFKGIQVSSKGINPVKDKVSFELLLAETPSSVVNVSVSDALGRVLLQKQVENTGDEQSLDVTMLKEGLYFLCVRSEGYADFLRFVKE